MKAPARDRHDPKSLGTHEEKILLAGYVNDMASMHMAQPREAVIVVFKELLEVAGRRAPRLPLCTPPLIQLEDSLLVRKRAPSVAWFTNWKAQYGLASVSKASLQSSRACARQVPSARAWAALCERVRARWHQPQAP